MYHSSTRRKSERRLAPPAVRVAVVVRLEAVEAVLAASGRSTIGSVTSRTSRPVSEPKPSMTIAVVVERRDHRQPERLAELEVLGAAARGDVDDAGPLLLADLVPGDDAVLVGRVRRDR